MAELVWESNVTSDLFKATEHSFKETKITAMYLLYLVAQKYACSATLRCYLPNP